MSTGVGCSKPPENVPPTTLGEGRRTDLMRADENHRCVGENSSRISVPLHSLGKIEISESYTIAPFARVSGAKPLFSSKFSKSRNNTKTRTAHTPHPPSSTSEKIGPDSVCPPFYPAQNSLPGICLAPLATQRPVAREFPASRESTTKRRPPACHTPCSDQTSTFHSAKLTGLKQVHPMRCPSIHNRH